MACWVAYAYDAAYEVVGGAHDVVCPECASSVGEAAYESYVRGVVCCATYDVCDGSSTDDCVVAPDVGSCEAYGYM